MNPAILSPIGIEAFVTQANDKYREKERDLLDRERDSMDKRNQLIPDAWKAPCKTCGGKYGFQDNVPPYYIWCINNECEAYHHVFTPVEWQQGLKEAT